MVNKSTVTVTFEEAMAKLIGYEGAPVPENLLRRASNDAWSDNCSEATAELNRKLGFCSMEDALAVRMECIANSIVGWHITRPSDNNDAPLPSQEQKTLQALLDYATHSLETALHNLDIYKATFQTDCIERPGTIKTAPSPTAIQRYYASSISEWAQTTFDLEIEDWHDISNINLFTDGLPSEVDASREQRKAYFDVFDAMMRLLIDLKPIDLEGGNRFVPEWKGCLKGNGSLNVAETKSYIENQLLRLNPPSKKLLPQPDVFYDRLHGWYRFYLTGLFSARPLYSNEKLSYTKLLITGLLIGLAHNSYGEELAESDSGDWPLPEDTVATIEASIKRISAETTREIIRRSVNEAMRKMRKKRNMRG